MSTQTLDRFAACVSAKPPGWASHERCRRISSRAAPLRPGILRRVFPGWRAGFEGPPERVPVAFARRYGLLRPR